MADRQAEVEHRHRAAAHVGHAGELRGQPGQLEQRRAAQHLLHLEHVDAEQLAAAEPEQEQGQPVVAGKAGALVDAVEQVVRHVSPIGVAGADLSTAARLRAA